VNWRLKLIKLLKFFSETRKSFKFQKKLKLSSVIIFIHSKFKNTKNLSVIILFHAKFEIVFRD